MLYANEGEVRPEVMMIKFAAIVTKEFFGESYPGKVVFRETFRDGNVTFVREWITIYPARK